MKKEYDFTDAEQGKFYRPSSEHEVPIYLDPEIEQFYLECAEKGHKPLNILVNTILRKEMEILKTVGS